MGQFMTEGPLFRAHSRVAACRKVVALLLIGAMLLSCAGYSVRGTRPRGVYHRVKSGETLSAIARAYNVKLQDLAEINNIDRPDQIEADSVIFVPDATQVVDDVQITVRARDAVREKPAALPPAAVTKEAAPPALPRKEPPKKETVSEPVKRREKAPVDTTTRERATVPKEKERGKVAPKVSGKPEGDETPPPTVKKEETPLPPTVKKRESVEKSEEIQFDKDRFIWPVKGKVIARFGIQPNRMNFNGIRIAAAEETAVQAAASGTVIFSAPLKDYGETIIIKHEDNYATVYTHLGTRAIREDARVRRGDRIAFLGKAGEKEEAYLYFEIRHHNKARNPLFFLP
jgi:lipoprotein NlpD